MTMNNNKKAENLFWIEYGQDLIEELNFRLILEWLDSGYLLTDTLLIVETIEYKGISYKKKNWLKKIWYFIKNDLKRKKE